MPKLSDCCNKTNNQDVNIYIIMRRLKCDYCKVISKCDYIQCEQCLKYICEGCTGKYADLSSSELKIYKNHIGSVGSK